MNADKKIKISNVIGKIILGLVLTVILFYVLIVLFLLVYGLINSLKPYPQFVDSTLAFPKGGVGEWDWKNYVDVFMAVSVPYPGLENEFVYFPEQLFNSMVYAGGCAFFSTFIPCITAYGCAKFPYKFSKILYVVVVAVMGLPIVGSLPSEIMMAQNLGLYDQMWGVWLMKANFLGMYFLVFFASFQSLPKDFAEAARMDGASNFRILFQISLPMVRNTFFVILLLKFIEFWNDYQTPMIYLRSFPTAALGIYSFSFSYGTQSSWPPMKITGSMILLLPVLIVFLCFHDKMIGNVSMGGIKE